MSAFTGLHLDAAESEEGAMERLFLAETASPDANHGKTAGSYGDWESSAGRWERASGVFMRSVGGGRG
jgi:hypothetical protein